MIPIQIDLTETQSIATAGQAAPELQRKKSPKSGGYLKYVQEDCMCIIILVSKRTGFSPKKKFLDSLPCARSCVIRPKKFCCLGQEIPALVGIVREESVSEESVSHIDTFKIQASLHLFWNLNPWFLCQSNGRKLDNSQRWRRLIEKSDPLLIRGSNIVDTNNPQMRPCIGSDDIFEIRRTKRHVTLIIRSQGYRLRLSIWGCWDVIV